MAEPIKIIITQGGAGGAGLTGNQPGAPKGRDTDFGTEGQDLMKSVGFSKKEQLAIAGIVTAASKKYIMNSINNYSSATGSYIKQTHLMDAMSTGLQIGGTTLGVLGAFAVSPTTGIIAAGAAAVKVGMNISQEIAQYNIAVSKTNLQAERNRIRAGMSIANGSRGTEN